MCNVWGCSWGGEGASRAAQSPFAFDILYVSDDPVYVSTIYLYIIHTAVLNFVETIGRNLVNGRNPRRVRASHMNRDTVRVNDGRRCFYSLFITTTKAPPKFGPHFVDSNRCSEPEKRINRTTLRKHGRCSWYIYIYTYYITVTLADGYALRPTKCVKLLLATTTSAATIIIIIIFAYIYINIIWGARSWCSKHAHISSHASVAVYWLTPRHWQH